LASLGGGIKIQFKSNFSIKLEWAYPIGDAPIRGTGPSTFYIAAQTST
jgi:hypothetical protein